MKRLGLNRGAYLGQTIDIESALREALGSARQRGWNADWLDAAPGIQIPTLTRPPANRQLWAPRVYVSAGIHGDEPAGPLAIQELIRQDLFPVQAWLWICPCLNPTGFPRNTRTSAAGVDLNRDYRSCITPEVRAHIAWLRSLPVFDMAVCLHEDWEAAGFYVYELNPSNLPSIAPAMLESVKDVCPIDLSPVIDGRDASEGLIRPNLDPASRAEWPEAFFLIQNKTRLSYTLEAPSDYQLDVRVAALTRGVAAAIRELSMQEPGRQRDDGTAPPP